MASQRRVVIASLAAGGCRNHRRHHSGVWLQWPRRGQAEFVGGPGHRGNLLGNRGRGAGTRGGDPARSISPAVSIALDCSVVGIRRPGIRVGAGGRGRHHGPAEISASADMWRQRPLLNGPAEDAKGCDQGPGGQQRELQLPASQQDASGSRLACTRWARGQYSEHRPAQRRDLHRRSRRGPGRTARRTTPPSPVHATHVTIEYLTIRNFGDMGRRRVRKASSTTIRELTGRSPTRRSLTTRARASCSAATTYSPGAASRTTSSTGSTLILAAAR